MGRRSGAERTIGYGNGNSATTKNHRYSSHEAHENTTPVFLQLYMPRPVTPGKFLGMAYQVVTAFGPRQLKNTVMKDCPKCGLTNPASALRCDCGFDFSSKKIEASCLSQEELTRVQQRTQDDTLSYVIKGVLFVAVVLAFSVIGASVPDGWGRQFVIFLALVSAWTVANIYGPKLREWLKRKGKQQA